MPRSSREIHRIVSGATSPPPIATWLGFRLTSVEPGEAVIAFEAGGRHANPMGTRHGGVLCDLADAARGQGIR
jgi:acyl-coenzyme A thioesterase PaaI-like protein